MTATDAPPKTDPPPSWTDPLDAVQRARNYALTQARYLLGDETRGALTGTKSFPRDRSVADLICVADFIIRGTALDDDPDAYLDPRRPLTADEKARAHQDFGRFVERMTSAGLPLVARTDEKDGAA